MGRLGTSELKPGRRVALLENGVFSQPNQETHIHAILQTIGAVLVLPYVALAGFFLLVGEAARAKGLFALLDIVLHHASWIVRWGIYAFALLWLGLVVMGFLAQFQRISALCLCLLAIGSLLVIVVLPSSDMEFGQLLFLAPCVAVAATSGWLFMRAGHGA